MSLWSKAALFVAPLLPAGCDGGVSNVPAFDSDSTSIASAPASDPIARYTYAQQRGSRLFDRYCAICHGADGSGDGFNAFNLDPRPRDLTDREYLGALSDASLAEIITQGGRGVNRSVLMPAYGHTLTTRQIDDLVAYLRTLTETVRQETE